VVETGLEIVEITHPGEDETEIEIETGIGEQILKGTKTAIVGAVGVGGTRTGIVTVTGKVINQKQEIRIITRINRKGLITHPMKELHQKWNSVSSLLLRTEFAWIV